MFGAPENPLASHQAVLRLTYGLIPVIVLMSLVTYLLGIAMPVWLIALQGAIILGATRRQESLLGRGVFTMWMPGAHLNLALLMLSVWVLFSGGIVSPFVWVYAVAIAIYGVFWGMGWALGTATLCTAYLFIIMGFTRMGVGTGALGMPAVGIVRVFLVSYIGMFYLVAAFSGVLRQQTRDVLHLAHTDPLTGLANRRTLRNALDRELARASRYGHPCAVLVLEIDRFKEVNDRFGHLAGDEALRKVAATLTGSCRATDTLARFGGDEFVVVLPHATAEEAYRVGERICRDVEEFTLLRGFHLTLSAGLAVYPSGGETSQALLDAADRAMYVVKRRGGNAVERAEGLSILAR